jgi:hypothetical protein
MPLTKCADSIDPALSVNFIAGEDHQQCKEGRKWVRACVLQSHHGPRANQTDRGEHIFHQCLEAEHVAIAPRPVAVALLDAATMTWIAVSIHGQRRRKSQGAAAADPIG